MGGKRAFDLFAAGAGLVALAPVMFCFWVVITIADGWPALYRQERVGRNGEHFELYKFRTMNRGTADVPTHLASTEALTRIGGWLRRTKADELPQLWNVVRGDMSLVGPRPCLPSQVELIRLREAQGVFELRPGITGPAQLAGIDMSQPDELANLDATYKDHQSVLYDLRCLISTARGTGAGDALRPKPE